MTPLSHRTDRSTTLLDGLMPSYDVIERHATMVHATPDAVYAAIRSADLTGGLLTRTLFAMRAVPAALFALLRSPRAGLSQIHERTGRIGVRLADFERVGFRVIAEHPPEEVVIGLLGRFWTPRGDLRADVSVATFGAGPPPGLALAAWNFTIHPQPAGFCELRTETRVCCAADARLWCRTYWLIVRPGSGLIRRAMLRAIRREAERRS